MDPISLLVSRFGRGLLPVSARAARTRQGVWHLPDHQRPDHVGITQVLPVESLSPWCDRCALEVLSGRNLQNRSFGVLRDVVPLVSHLARDWSVGVDGVDGLDGVCEALEALDAVSDLLASDAAVPHFAPHVLSDLRAGAATLRSTLASELVSERAFTRLLEVTADLLGGVPADFDDTPTLLAVSSPALRLTSWAAWHVLSARGVPAGDHLVAVVPHFLARHLGEESTRRSHVPAQSVTLRPDDSPVVLEVAAGLFEPPERGGEIVRSGQSLRRVLEAARRV